MNARGFRSLSVTLLMLGASFAIVAASATTRVQVSANRDLVIAIVDAQRDNPERETLRNQIAHSLETLVTETCGADVHVRSTLVKARDAKLKLNGGNFDAALVIGSDRPLALRRLDLVTLAGNLPVSTGLQSVYFIMADGDPALNQRLREAFGRLVAEHRLPDAASPLPMPNFRNRGSKFADAN